MTTDFRGHGRYQCKCDRGATREATGEKREGEKQGERERERLINLHKEMQKVIIFLFKLINLVIKYNC